MMASLILNAVVALLLLAVLAAGFWMQRRMEVWRADRAALEPVVRALSDAVERAHDAIHQLRATAIESDARLTEKTATARKLANELQLLSEFGESVAARIERAADDARGRSAAAATAAGLPADTAEAKAPGGERTTAATRAGVKVRPAMLKAIQTLR